jgi:hypothetical protein
MTDGHAPLEGFAAKGKPVGVTRPMVQELQLKDRQWSGFAIRYPQGREFVKRMSNPKLH